MNRIIAKKNTVLLKSNITLDEIKDLAEKKKTSLFGMVFKRPKPEEINILSIDLFFESIWKIAGEYNVDFYRKNVHKISTDPNVKEVVIGNGVFSVITESGTWKKFKGNMRIGEKMNRIDIPVEEHVEIDRESEIYLNSQGQQIEPNLKIQSKNIENFSDDFIKLNKNNIRSSGLTEDQIVEIYLELVKNDLGEFLRIVSERLVINNLEEIFLPIYEIRFVDLKNTTKILRVDGMTSKTL